MRLAHQLKPDVILMDIDMPGTNGLQATRRIKDSLAGATVLLLSAWDSEAYRQGPADCGADNYLLKTMPISESLCHPKRETNEGCRERPLILH